MKNLLYKLKRDYRDQINSILNSSGFFYDFEVDIALSIFDETIKKGQEKSGYFWNLVEEDDKILGFSIFGPNPSTIDSWDLYWLVVSNKHRNESLGTALLEDAERIAREKKCNLLWVETSGRKQYFPTRKFYESLEYKKAATLKGYYAPDDDMVIYRKDLRNSSILI